METRVGSQGQDRAKRFAVGDHRVFVVADGAGGVGSGALAAEAVVLEAEALAHGLHACPSDALRCADAVISGLGGMAAGVIIEVRGGILRGASCGDCIAWLLRDRVVADLSAGQLRRPMLGAGGTPVSFGPIPFSGRLLLASDGLVNYASRDDVLSIAASGPVSWAASALAELPRLSAGSFPDDVAVIVAESD